MLGLHCMIYILQHPYNKKIVLRQNLAQVNFLFVDFYFIGTFKVIIIYDWY
jgi:hypothetical protein